MLFIRTGSGLVVQVNDNVLAEPGADARSEATWEAALQSLVDSGLLVDRGQQGEVFRVTVEEYAEADVLRAAAQDRINT